MDQINWTAFVSSTFAMSVQYGRGMLPAFMYQRPAPPAPVEPPQPAPVDRCATLSPTSASDDSSPDVSSDSGDSTLVPASEESTLILSSDDETLVPDSEFEFDDNLSVTSKATKHEQILYFKDELAKLFRQMMFVSGETAEPSPETTSLIEEIVRQQVIEIVRPPAPSSVYC